MGRRIDHFVGEKRWQLTLLEELPDTKSPNGTINRFGRMTCDCGSETIVNLAKWRSGYTKSCGHLRAESTTLFPATHGATGTPLYQAWLNMRTRCSPEWQKKHPTYRYVKHCPEWVTYEGFLESPPNGRLFEEGLQLSRLGDTGDYTPENTRWLTASENAREMIERRMHRLGAEFAVDVARRNGISDNAFGNRLRRGWSIKDAATKPMRTYPR